MNADQINSLAMLIAIALQPVDPMSVFEKGYLAGRNMDHARPMCAKEEAAFRVLCQKYGVATR